MAATKLYATNDQTNLEPLSKAPPLHLRQSIQQVKM